LSKAVCDHIKEQSEKLEQELGPKVREQLEKGREKLQQEMKQFRFQMSSDSFDI
jgi:hypothetical protein